MRASQAASVIIISSKDISSISSSFGSPGACRGLAARRARRVEPFLGTSLNLPNGLGFPGLARGRPDWADIRSGPGAGRGSAPQSSRDAVGRSRRLHAGCTSPRTGIIIIEQLDPDYRLRLKGLQPPDTYEGSPT